MSVSEVISSGLLESYVLGLTTAEETAQVQELCARHPELLREIEAIEDSLITASAQMGKGLNPTLKDKIAAQLEFKNEATAPQEAKVVPLNTRSLTFYKVGIAASLLLFVCSTIYSVMLHKKLGQVSTELAALSAEKSYMARQMQVQQASEKTMRQELAIAGDPKVIKVPLNGMNTMASKAATILWNSQTKEVYFNAGAMPAPAGKQYQLWAIVDGKPVDAGMIELNADSGIVFQKMKTIVSAQAFAVTIENVGGSPTPSLETMCLLGNV